VFVAGLGDTGEAAWGTVWGQVARSPRACIYDRAGIGGSSRGPTAATYQGVVDDLHALLRSAHIWLPKVQRLLPAGLFSVLQHNPEGLNLRHGLASVTPLDTPGALGHRPLAMLWAAWAALVRELAEPSRLVMLRRSRTGRPDLEPCAPADGRSFR
jgi:hypothetical protein